MLRRCRQTWCLVRCKGRIKGDMRRKMWIAVMALAMVFACCGLSVKCGVALAADDSGNEFTTTDGRYKYRIIDAEKNEVELVRAIQKQDMWTWKDGVPMFEVPSMLEDKYHVVKLGQNAFSGLTSVKGTSILNYKHVDNTIIIPDTVREIDYGCFHGCTDTTEFVIPSSVTTFGGQVFLYTPWLEKERETRLDHLVIVNDILIDGREATGDIRVPEWVKEIAPFAFFGSNVKGDALENYSGSSITSILIPSSVKKIGKLSFCKNYNLTKIDMRQGLEEIGMQAFYDCRKISELDLPASVKILGAGAFYNCIGISSVTLPDSLETYGQNIFGKGTELTTHIVVTVPESITNVDGWHTDQEQAVTYRVPKGSVVEEFMKKNGLTYKVYSNSNTEPKPTPSKNEVKVGTVFRSGVLYYVVTSGSTVRVKRPYNKSYTVISIPHTVTYKNKSYKVTAIQSKAFAGCTNLTRLVIGNNVKIIGVSAFSGCSSLVNISIGTGLESIYSRAFYRAKSLKYLSIKSRKLKSVGSEAFAGITANTVVSYPAGLEKDYANKTRIVSVKNGTVFVSGGLWYAVSSTSMVKVRRPVNRTCASVAVPNTVKYKGKTFNVTAISANAFKNCTSLKKIYIADNVKVIGDYSFKGCKALKLVVVGSANNNNSSQLTTIGKEAFRGVFIGGKGIVKVYLRTMKLKTVGKQAFKGAEKKNASVWIPYNGKLIAEAAK